MTSSLALLNGRVYTQDPVGPLAAAVAVVGNRIVRVGSDREIVEAAGPRAERIDLEGRALLPGFVDAHFHLLTYCLGRDRLQLEGIESVAEILALVARAVEQAPPGAWILGSGWDRNLWPGAELPTRQMLDRVAAGRPACLNSRDFHAVWANTAALELARIDRDTPDPPGGRIVREPNRAARGIPL